MLSAPSKKSFSSVNSPGLWRDETIYDLVRAHSEQAPERIALRSTHGDLTYRALVTHADAFASDLAGKGLAAGQRVAVWLPSRPETVIALLACSHNGYVCSPSLHRDHTVGDTIGLLKRMRATAIVAEEAYGADAAKNDLFAQLSQEVETIQHVYRLKKLRSGSEVGIVAVPPAGAPRSPAPPNANRVVYLAFTSGTRLLIRSILSLRRFKI